MKTAISVIVAGALAAALVHCSANGTEGSPSSPSGAPSNDAATEDATDAAEPSADAGDATVDADTDAGVCSADGWCRVSLPRADLDLQALWAFAANDAWAVGAGGMVHWDGATWSMVDAPDAGLEGLTSLWSSSPNDLWGVARNQRRLVHGSRTSPTAPFTWRQTTYDDGPTFTTLKGVGSHDLWVLGNGNFGNVFLHAVVPDTGEAASAPAWTTVPIGYDYFYASSFAVTENNELWATGFTSAAVVIHASRTDPDGDTWVWDQDLDTTGQPYAYFIDLWAPSANDIWAIGTPGFSYHRGPGADGATWKPIENHANLNAASVWGSSVNDVWTVGESGAVRHWDGTSWSLSRLAVDGIPNYRNLTSVHGSAADDVWAVGPGMALHRTGASK